jgi:hypothetical protein
LLEELEEEVLYDDFPAERKYEGLSFFFVFFALELVEDFFAALDFDDDFGRYLEVPFDVDLDLYLDGFPL